MRAAWMGAVAALVVASVAGASFQTGNPPGGATNAITTNTAQSITDAPKVFTCTRGDAGCIQVIGGLYTSGDAGVPAMYAAGQVGVGAFGSSTITGVPVYPMVYIKNQGNKTSNLYLEGTNGIGGALMSMWNTTGYGISLGVLDGALTLSRYGEGATVTIQMGLPPSIFGHVSYPITLKTTTGAAQIDGITLGNSTVQTPNGVQLNTTTAAPACNSTNRGLFWTTRGGAGVADVTQQCMKNALDAYAWVTIATGV